MVIITIITRANQAIPVEPLWCHLRPGTTLERTQEQSQHRPFIANGHTARIPVQDGTEAEEVPLLATAAVIAVEAVAADLAATVAVTVVVADIVVAAVEEAARVTAEAEVAAEVLPHRVVEAPVEAEAEEATEW